MLYIIKVKTATVCLFSLCPSSLPLSLFQVPAQFICVRGDQELILQFSLPHMLQDNGTM